MINPISPIVRRGLTPVPVLPTVYDDALSYGEQTGKMVEKIDECVDKVNEVVGDNNDFKTDLTNQQNTFETSITNQQNTFETNITNRQNTYETNLTNRQNTWEQNTTEGLNTWKTNTANGFQSQITEMNTEWDNFIEEYQREYGVTSNFGNSDALATSQNLVTSALKNSAIIENVGANNVLYGKSYTIDKSMLDLQDGAIKKDLTIQGTTNKHYAIKSKNINKLSVSGTTSDIPDNIPIAFVDDGEYIYTIIPSNITNSYEYTFEENVDGTIYLNFYSTDVYPNAPTSITVTYNTEYEIIKNNIVNDLNSGIYTHNVAPFNILEGVSKTFEIANFETVHKIINMNTLVESSGGYYTTIPCKYIKKITFNGTTSGLLTSYPMAFLVNGLEKTRLIGANITDTASYEFDEITSGTLYLQWFNRNDTTLVNAPNNVVLELWSADELSNKEKIKYYNYLSPTINLNGKTVYFFGDSIMYGYIEPNVRANPTIPQSVSTMLNCTGINNAVNGASYVLHDGYPNIVNRIEDSSLNCDYIIIEGGINDWVLGSTKTELKTALNNLCTYLKANYTGTVIFVTPFNECGWTNASPKMSVDEVRNIISEIAFENNYFVIQGEEITPANSQSPLSLIEAVFKDKLHPTQQGYNMLSNNIAKLLK